MLCIVSLVVSDSFCCVLFPWLSNISQVTARALFNYDAANDEEVATGTARTSRLTPHTSHLTPHTSHLTPHTSHLTPHTSHLTPHTSHLIPHTSHLTPHTSQLTLLENQIIEVTKEDDSGWWQARSTHLQHKTPNLLRPSNAIMLTAFRASSTARKAGAYK